MSATPPSIDVDALLPRYAAVLLDAFGVLVDGRGPLPGGSELIAELTRRGIPYLIVTNDASRLPSSAAALYRRAGLSIPEERILTSGELLVPYFERHGLAGKTCVVLGPGDSATYVEGAGGLVISADESRIMEVLVLADESGFPMLETLDAVLTGLLHRLDRRQPVALILPNPDLVYPKGPESMGLAIGSLAALIEAVLAQRYPDRGDRQFARLGKPYPAIFEAAVTRLGTRRVVMLGDQLPTDIAGAASFGLDSALVGTGLTPLNRDWGREPVKPTWLMASLVAERGWTRR